LWSHNCGAPQNLRNTSKSAAISKRTAEAITARKILGTMRANERRPY
jgi:hypothetical protein